MQRDPERLERQRASAGRDGIVGREPELEELHRLFEENGPAGLVMEGEAGIGKTTLWLHGVEQARRSRRVLAARPAEGEAALPFSALGDLLEPLLDGDGVELPEPHRAALDHALQRRRRPEPASRLAVSRAVVALLRDAAAQSPLVVAVDDVQWLDPPSAEVLEFALRRLEDSPVRVLVARRGGTGEPLPLGLEERRPVRRLQVGPLSVDELHALLAQRAGAQLPRPRLVDLHRMSRGNPYYALEVVRALELRSGPLAQDESLPVPDGIGALLRERLEALSDAAREAVLLVAASPQPTAALVYAAGGSATGLEEALAGGIVARDGERLRFAHPLLAAVAYEFAPRGRRREAHRRLAAATGDPEERIRHLASSAAGPDERVASQLDEAAAQVALRGAPSAAVELLEQAIRLTPPSGRADRRRRLSGAAEHSYAAGDQPRSRAFLELLAAELPAGPERASVLARLSQRLPYHLDGLELCRRALHEADGDPAVQARLHFFCAASARRVTTLHEAAEHARLAVELAGAAGDDAQRARALAMLGHVEALRGAGDGLEILERAVELATSLADASLHFRPSFLLGITLLYRGELERARPWLEAQVERAGAQGDEVARGVALSTVAELELRAGNWARAYRYATEGAALQEQAAPLHDQAHHVLRVARVAAHLGKVEEARPLASRLLELAPVNGDRGAEIAARRDAGFLELSLGNPAAAVELLDPAARLVTEMGVALLSALPFVHDLVESLVALGRVEAAETANALLDRSTRPWERTLHARGRALIAGARGDHAAAAAAIAEALAGHELLAEPFELGRTLLVQGSLERRARHRSAARTALTRALEVFDQLGAPLWAEKAGAELARIPGRGPAAGNLTETERRVAELVASGLSNKEVAARLFVTVRTVEGNLTRIYGKLGVRSRTELAARLGRQ